MDSQFKYELKQKIGEGTYGKVYIGEKDGKTFAIKFIKKQEGPKFQLLKKYIKDEANIQKKLRHPNICYLQQFYQYDKLYVFVLEYCGGNSLHSEINNRKANYNYAQTLDPYRQIIDGLSVIHKKGIIHRDLKLQNILLQKSQFSKTVYKIADFGFSTVKNVAKTYCGTETYMAPEILGRQQYTNKVDVWSVGCIIYTMIFLEPPFKKVRQIQQSCQNGFNILSHIQKIKRAQVRKKASGLVNQSLAQFFQMVFVLDPQSRASIEDLKKCRYYKDAVADYQQRMKESSSNKISVPPSQVLSQSHKQKQKVQEKAVKQTRGGELIVVIKQDSPSAPKQSAQKQRPLKSQSPVKQQTQAKQKKQIIAEAQPTTELIIQLAEDLQITQTESQFQPLDCRKKTKESMLSVIGSVDQQEQMLESFDQQLYGKQLSMVQNYLDKFRFIANTKSYIEARVSNPQLNKSFKLQVCRALIIFSKRAIDKIAQSEQFVAGISKEDWDVLYKKSPRFDTMVMNFKQLVSGIRNQYVLLYNNRKQALAQALDSTFDKNKKSFRIAISKILDLTIAKPHIYLRLFLVHIINHFIQRPQIAKVLQKLETDPDRLFNLYDLQKWLKNQSEEEARLNIKKLSDKFFKGK